MQGRDGNAHEAPAMVDQLAFVGAFTSPVPV